MLKNTSSISCENCNGACCKWLFLSANMPRETYIFMRVRGARDLGDGRIAVPSVCDKLKEGQCSIYAGRPTECKKFLVGGKDCLLARKLEGL